MDYQIQFELLLSKTKEISANQRISYFVSGLQEEIKANMQMAQPCSLDIAICLTENMRFWLRSLKGPEITIGRNAGSRIQMFGIVIDEITKWKSNLQAH